MLLVAIQLVTWVGQLFKNLQFHTAFAYLLYLVRLFETSGKVMSFSPVLHIKNSRLWHQREKNFLTTQPSLFRAYLQYQKPPKNISFFKFSVLFEPNIQ